MLIIFFDVCLFLLAVIFIYSLIRAMVKRANFLRRLRRICSDKCYAIERTRLTVSSFFRVGTSPDLVIHTANCDYRIRFLTCILRIKFYHFVSPLAFATYFKLGIVLPMARDASTTILLPRYHELPPLEDFDKTQKKDILLFNPLPVEITFFEEKSGTHAVSNGTKIGDFTVYDGSHFIELLKS